MWTSQSTRNAELYPAMATLLFIFIYLLICFIRNRSGKGYSTHKTGVKRPVLFLFTLFLFLSYLNCPHSIGGAGSIDIRLGYLLPLFLLIALSASQWKNMEKKIFIAVSFLITIGYLGIRFPYVMRASAIGKEIMTAGPYIRDKGVVLNLHYDDNQSLPGNDTLFQKDNSFLHFSEFLGAEKNKHLIMVMNYEAEISYFPVNWNFNKNPRLSIEKMIQNNYPPCGKVHRYENQIGQNVDYVLFQNWKKEFEKETCTANLLREMDSLGFYKKYESPKQAIIVYERRM